MISDILLISSSTMPGLERVSAKNDIKLTDFNTAVSSPDQNIFDRHFSTRPTMKLGQTNVKT